jgi:hypothetical protein
MRKMLCKLVEWLDTRAEKRCDSETNLAIDGGGAAPGPATSEVSILCQNRLAKASPELIRLQ